MKATLFNTAPNMPDFLATFNFETAAEFLAALSPWTSTINLNGYIFRGHSDDEYELVPTSIRRALKEKFWRICGLGKPIDDQSEWEALHSRAEYNLLREFYKLADRNGLHVPHAERVRAQLASTFDTSSPLMTRDEEWLPNDLLELAGLAQHYGLPTRLLDWSNDPLISAYFAAASAEPDRFLSIYALDVDTVSFMNKTVHRSPLRIVTPPYYGNPNLAAQSGIFTSWSIQMQPVRDIFNSGGQLIDRRPLDVLLKAHMENNSWTFQRSPFLKFKLPTKHAPDILKFLEAAGYGASRIFPGYGGVAEEVVRRHQNYLLSS